MAGELPDALQHGGAAPHAHLHYPLVNHKDENKQNPCDWNLEWATHSYNVTYSKNREEEPQYTSEVPDLPAMSWV